MVTSLDAVIGEAYDIFSRYRLQRTLGVCHCSVCLTDANESQLLATPLRAISADLLAAYTDAVVAANAAQLGCEFRYFLPRYLDLIARDQPPDTMGFDICLRRLRDCEWRSAWPKAQMRVIDDFFDGYMVACLPKTELVRWPAGQRLSFNLADILTMVITAQGDIDRVLAVWDKSDHLGAALHMAAVRGELTDDEPRRLNNAHLTSDFKQQAETVAAFLARPEVDDRLEAALLQGGSVHHQQILSDALSR